MTARQRKEIWTPPIAGWQYPLTHVSFVSDPNDHVWTYEEKNLVVRYSETKYSNGRMFCRLEMFTTSSARQQHYARTGRSLRGCAHELTKHLHAQHDFLGSVIEGG